MSKDDASTPVPAPPPAVPAPDPAPTGADDGARRGAWASTRPLLLRLHFYAGVLVAPFIAVAALTGLVYVWTPQLEQVVYADLLTVEAGAGTVPLADQVTAAAETRPDATVLAVRPAADPGDATRVLADADGLPESHRLAVFVDPHTGEVLGETTGYGSSGSLPVRSWVATFHRNLHLGETGRIYSELAATWIWVIALGGTALWIGRRRRAVRRVLLPDTSATGRARTLSWHGAVGVWALVGVLVLAATGLTWSRFAGENIGELRQAWGWSTPSLSAPAPSDHGGHTGHGEHTGHGDHGASAVDVDAVLASARDAGLSGSVEVTLPVEEGAAYTVRETGDRWPTRKDAVAVDSATGEVVEELRFADHPFPAKLTTWGIAFHMGLLFGVANQVLLTVVALGVLALVAWGYRMWWLRRPTRAGAWAVGRPVARGAWSALPWWGKVLVVAIAVAVGRLLPVFAVSLAAFVLVDLLLAARARRRTATTT
ncbi:PepSY-associated TM helix domain-containing protein [Nocardiopsis sp. N85]|uniref:PepSY-associated TM helix domain-containing protein n=1 Tax=Nocardiopsis sp. N85 TaxID=3029400 RepID=UPI00237F38DF|nr:PepSY-associated TM helix domain-containing protein [Nocardiopsis sp. N85]MDE3724641.1 PepSY-associated TM helix domain-containing protein [Nocardiopsis sp. N85]